MKETTEMLDFINELREILSNPKKNFAKHVLKAAIEELLDEKEKKLLEGLEPST